MANEFKNLLDKVMMQDIMRKKVPTVYEDEDLSVVETTFINSHIYYLPVINRNDELVGLVSRKYLYKTQSPRKIIDKNEIAYDPRVIVDGDTFYSKETLENFVLRTVMLKTPLKSKKETALSDVVSRMAAKRMGCTIVVDDDKHILGICTSEDIINFIATVIMV